ncbi:MAG: carbohydrate-binding protein, partial [Thalassotalea sp.]
MKQPILSNTNKWLASLLLVTLLSACGGGEENAAPVVNNDLDGDKVVNSSDLCANTPANSIVNTLGCPDSDNDSIFDNTDSCPNTLAGITVDNTGCAVIVAADTDNDGISDQLDSCPNTIANSIVNASGCADSDNDGVFNDSDMCPNTAFNITVDATGCESITPTGDIIIQAEDYLNYFDVSPTNEGGANYRNDQVDIENTTDEGAGYNIGFTEASEWLTYSVTLAAGTYAITTRVAADTGGGKYTLSINNQTIGTDTMSSTGGWQVFESHHSNSFAITSGTHTLRLDVNSGPFNINWLKIYAVIDDDQDGIANNLDSCPNTLANSTVNNLGCPDSDQDGVFDNLDNCPATEPDSYVDFFGCKTVKQLIEVAFNNDILVGGDDSPNPGFTLYTFSNDNGSSGSNCNNDCASNWPPLLVTDGVASGVPDLSTITRADGTIQVTYDNKPLYFYIGDTAKTTTQGANIPGWQVQEYGLFGDISPLYTSSTLQEHAIIYDTSDAVITKLADRGRDRHAKEDQFQQYDHYLSHYWTHRTARYKFTDYVAKGGSSILIEWVTEWQLDALEFRAWYSGMNTVAQYHGNYEPNVVTVGSGTFDDDLIQTSTSGDQYKYSLTINEFRGLNGDSAPLSIGQHMEIEVSQFLLGVPEGRTNYYGTTYLYQVGKGGMVPWQTVGDFDNKSSERENSHPIDKSGWLGGNTTLPYQYTNEPNDHFMQMATNLSSLNGQPFVLGRRIHHTSFVDGSHDEDPANGVFAELGGKSGPHYVNTSCANCHERNGRAAPAPIGEALDKWVFKIANADGQADANRGKVLQPSNTGVVTAEGTVAIASWTEVNGLRSPNYYFSTGTPEKFSARIAPQLVGLGLLEAIPEEAILALADVNDEFAPFGISGKA